MQFVTELGSIHYVWIISIVLASVLSLISTALSNQEEAQQKLQFMTPSLCNLWWHFDQIPHLRSQKGQLPGRLLRWDLMCVCVCVCPTKPACVGLCAPHFCVYTRINSSSEVAARVHVCLWVIKRVNVCVHVCVCVCVCISESGSKLLPVFSLELMTKKGSP